MPALPDGRAWTVGEPAAGAAASTASENAGVLTDAGFVDTGRAGTATSGCPATTLAELIERRARRLPATGLRENRLAAARACYNHPAGRRGVACSPPA